jgi:hypothetical protein
VIAAGRGDPVDDAKRCAATFRITVEITSQVSCSASLTHEKVVTPEQRRSQCLHAAHRLEACRSAL